MTHTDEEPTTRPADLPADLPAVPARRRLLRQLGMGAAAAGSAAVAAVGTTGTAGAATGDALSLGRTANAAGATTAAAYTGTATNVHAFTFADNSGTVPQAHGTAVVVGHATTLDTGVQGTAQLRGAAGVGGYSAGVNGVGVRAAASGAGGTGLSATGGSVAVATTMPPAEDNAAVTVTGARRGLVTSPTTTFPLSLAPGAQTGPPTTAAVVGDVAVDAAGTVWFCTVAGAPGTFVRLGGTGGAGQFTPISPVRVYDTRVGSPAPGPFAMGTVRTVSVARALGGTVDVVPPRATAISFNLTITRTTGAGWVAVDPGDATSSSTSSINWFGAGQTLANATVVKLDPSRRVRLTSGGPGTTEVVMDVTGYYL